MRARVALQLLLGRTTNGVLGLESEFMSAKGAKVGLSSHMIVKPSGASAGRNDCARFPMFHMTFTIEEME